MCLPLETKEKASVSFLGTRGSKFRWCSRQDSNLQGCPMDPKSIACTYFATGASLFSDNLRFLSLGLSAPFFTSTWSAGIASVRVLDYTLHFGKFQGNPGNLRKNSSFLPSPQMTLSTTFSNLPITRGFFVLAFR